MIKDRRTSGWRVTAPAGHCYRASASCRRPGSASWRSRALWGSPSTKFRTILCRPACGFFDDFEHLGDAVVGVADQPARGRDAVRAKRQLASGGCLVSHLVLEAGRENTVASDDLEAIPVEQILRHDEETEALSARAGARGTGQYQVQDVLDGVAAGATGNEPLDAFEVPGAVGLLDGFGAPGPHVGAGVRLGQHHRCAPTILDRRVG